MNLPVVAIVGRPNVGKSSLFNRFVGRRAAVVDDTPGVTRDRLYAPVEWAEHAFSLVDTGGLVLDPDDPVLEQVRTQIEIAVLEASVILFMVDVIAGLTPYDIEVAERLRSSGKPVLVVAHKADHPGLDANAAELYGLGFPEIYCVSSVHKRGVDALLDAIVARLPETKLPVEERRPLRIAIVGRPNAGKSSIVNALLGENRVIVDERPGTTRDAVNIRFNWQGAPFELVDTAGMRRRARIVANLERHSVLRATRSIEQSDVTWLVLDTTQNVGHQDKTIADFITRHHKLSVLVANKWDLVEKDHRSYTEYSGRLREEFRAFDHIPIVFTSAVTKKRLAKLLELSQMLYRAAATRISTATLNDFLRAAVMTQPPPMVRGRRCALKYITQTDVLPPTFVLFTNMPEAVSSSYERYLAHRLRETFQFEGVPLKFVYRGSRKEAS